LAEKRNGEDAFFSELVTTGVEYWTTVSRFMPDWQRVKNGLRPIELRQENISTHSVVLRALGGLGAEVMRQFPSDWKNRLADLGAVNWSKKKARMGKRLHDRQLRGFKPAGKACDEGLPETQACAPTDGGGGKIHRSLDGAQQR
jgi:hypothetical protein